MDSSPPIIFDQFSRYRACAMVLRRAGAPGDTVIDVGSGPGRLLGRFLPDWRVTYVDPLLGARGDDVFPLSFEEADFGGARFDFAVTVDTLEHVPPSAREAFLDRLATIATKGVVVAGPCRDAGSAEEIDRWVNAVYHEKSGRNYPWLDEHLRYGLPARDEIVAGFEARGWHVRVYPNGYGPWLRELLPVVLCLLDEKESHPLIDEVSAFFNEKLVAYDDRSPAYRQIVAAVRDPALLPESWPEPTPEGLREASDRWDELRQRLIAGYSRLIERVVDRRQERLVEERVLREALARLEHDPKAVLATWREIDTERRAVERERHELEHERTRLRFEQIALENRASAQEHELRALRLEHERRDTELDAIRSTVSWRVTAPLRASARLARGGARAAKRLVVRAVDRTGRFAYRRLPLPDPLRWRLTVLTCEGLRPLIRHTAAWNAYTQERAWRNGRPHRSSERSLPVPPPARGGREDVVVWGVIDWHFRFQRPQHLAEALARKGHRVFYVSPSFIDSPRPGFSAERLSEELPLYSIRLHARGRPVLYEGEPHADGLRQITDSVGRFLHWARIGSCLSFVDHPSWTSVAFAVPNGRVCYDCMDNHHAFEASGDLHALEERLVARADLVIASSRWLEERCRALNPRTMLVHNACEHEHFATPPSHVRTDPAGRTTIGYFGAIAEWFDVELVRAVAARYRDCRILLVGTDTARAAEALQGHANVQCVGEVPYSELPEWAHAMDVCLIPFVINDLTVATNPVKVYEYLAMGRPVVTTDLPELRDPAIDALIHRCADGAGFIDAVGRALAEREGDAIRRERRAFASGQSWEHRAEQVDGALASLAEPPSTVIIVSWNNLALTRRAIESVLADASPSPCEIVVVDNGSTDGTAEYLRELAQREPSLTAILNDHNAGFAAANNQGLERARGDFLVLLNNDTVVTDGWLRTLVNHLRRDPTIGLLGPITNNIGNEARVHVHYTDLAAMGAEAFQLTRSRLGRPFDIEVPAFFCVAFSRAVYEMVGPIDERYGLGFFEDDDYARRVRAAGWRTACAEDVYIHHELSASFGKLAERDRKALFEENRAYFESKWGEWSPHRYRIPQLADEPA